MPRKGSGTRPIAENTILALSTGEGDVPLAAGAAARDAKYESEGEVDNATPAL